MRAVVAVPLIRDFYFTPHRFSGLGAEIVVSILKDLRIEVTLFNFPLMKKKKRKLPLPPALAYLKSYILKNETDKLGFFTDFYEFGPTLEECIRIIKQVQPDIIFISCFAFCYAQSTIELADKLKNELCHIPIVAGGSGVSVHPLYFMREKSIDYCIIGEAEVSLPVFIKTIKNTKEEYSLAHMPNLYFNQGNKINCPIWFVYGIA